MSNDFTKGPWRPGFKNIGHVTAENGAVIAKCERLTSLVNLQANARLIAAAPDLLAALELVIREEAPAYHDCIDNGEQECAWCIARAAIDKATA